MEKMEVFKQVLGAILIVVLIVGGFLFAMNQLDQLAGSTATKQAQTDCNDKWDVPDAVSIDGVPHCIVTVTKYYLSGYEISSRRVATFSEMEALFGPPTDASQNK